LLLAQHFVAADLFLFAAIPPAVAGGMALVLLRLIGRENVRVEAAAAV